MAKVPVIRQGQGIAPLKLPYQRSDVSEVDFGGREARALQQAGVTIEQIGEQMRQKQRQNDANLALRAQIEADNELRPFLYEKQTGVMSRRGGNALGSYDETEAYLNDLEKKYESNLKNETQRRAFKGLWARKKETILNSVARHETTQDRVFQDENTAAIIEGGLRDIQGSPDDQAIIDQSIANMTTAIVANQQGLSSEALDYRLKDTVSNAHIAVVLSRNKNNPVFAKEYFDKYKDEIDPGKVKKVEDALDKGLIIQETGFKVDEIITASKDPKDWFAAANKLPGRTERDKQIKTAVTKELEHKMALEEKIRASSQRAVFDNALNNIDNGLPWDETAIRDKSKRDALKTIERENQLKKADPFYDTVTVPAKMEEWLGMSDEDKVKLTKDELTTKYRPHMSTADWLDTVEDWQTEQAKAGKESASAKNARKESEKTVMTFLKNDYNNGMFGDAGSPEARAEYLKQIESLKKWSRLNPDKDPSEYYEQISDVNVKSWIGKLAGAVSFGMIGEPEVTPKQRREEIERQGSNKQKRSQAIEILKKNKRPITENNISYVMERL